MQSDLSGLYYQYYRFACDTARRAEQTMKRELMRPELDATQFIQFNYWDTGHQGLLSGDPLGSQATKELQAMLDTAGQSSQALMFCLCFDFPTEWSAFVNGTADFAVTLQRLFFPYAVQNARRLTVDALTLYAASSGALASVTRRWTSPC